MSIEKLSKSNKDLPNSEHYDIQQICEKHWKKNDLDLPKLVRDSLRRRYGTDVTQENFSH